jgi:hypothetical protein
MASGAARDSDDIGASRANSVFPRRDNFTLSLYRVAEIHAVGFAAPLQ